MRGMWCYYSEKYESLKGFLTPRALHKHWRRKCTHGKVQVRKTWPETQQTTFTRKLNLTPTSAAPCSRVCRIHWNFKTKYLVELLLINSPFVKLHFNNTFFYSPLRRIRPSQHFRYVLTCSHATSGTRWCALRLRAGCLLRPQRRLCCLRQRCCGFNPLPMGDRWHGWV